MISIFIMAPFEQRKIHGVSTPSLKQVIHELKKMDKKHRKYFTFICKMYIAENYDICLTVQVMELRIR